MSTVLTRPPVKDRRLARMSAVAVAVVVAALLGFPLLEPPDQVARVTVVNELPWHIDVRVSGPNIDGALPLGTVTRQEPAEFIDVLDAGSQWAFRYSSAGVDAGRTDLTRDDLASRAWKLTVPAEAAEFLRAGGVPQTAD